MPRVFPRGLWIPLQTRALVPFGSLGQMSPVHSPYHKHPQKSQGLKAHPWALSITPLRAHPSSALSPGAGQIACRWSRRLVCVSPRQRPHPVSCLPRCSHSLRVGHWGVGGRCQECQRGRCLPLGLPAPSPPVPGLCIRYGTQGLPWS